MAQAKQRIAKPPSTPILQEGRTCWKHAHADRLAFLIDGAAYYDAFVSAVSRAQHSVLIVAWDVDSRVALRRGEGQGSHPPTLGRFLDEQAERTPGLHIHLLAWDFAMIYALEREPLAMFKLGWNTHPRVHMHLDDEHPLGGSQHQKIVVVDDRVAFAGGLDLTRSRWDTPQHLPGDPLRVDPGGKGYRPFHDVQVLVSGEAARSLGDLVRERWAFATGERLHLPPRPADQEGDPWPEGVQPEVEDVRVGIARTLPAFKNRPQVREVEALYEAAIGAARDTIYIENQYFTSTAVREALAGRLQDPDGPEVVMVLPRKSSGWLEETAMDNLLARQFQLLREANGRERLRLYYAACADDGQSEYEFIKVHAKLMIVDDRLVRVGSANLSNRSMGLDSECDLALEAGRGEEGLQEAILGLRHKLLGEHLDVKAEVVAERVKTEGSLIAAVESLRGGGRTLRELQPRPPAWAPALSQDDPLLDPEAPVELDRMIDTLVHDDAKGLGTRGHGWWLVAGAAGLFLAGLLLFWRFTPIGQAVDGETLIAWGHAVADSPATPLWMLLAYVLGALTLFPVTLLIGATATVFPPLAAFAYALLGSLAGAVATYGVGFVLGRSLVRRAAGDRLNRISRRLARRGVVAVLLVRVLPVAPFTIINMVSGASHIRFRDFVLGTLLGMTPGILGVTVLVDRVRAVILKPTAMNIGLLILTVLVLLAAGSWLARRLRRRVRGELEQAARGDEA